MLISFEISMPILFPKLEPPWLLRWSLVLLLSYYQNSSPSVANEDVTFPHSPFHLDCPISTVSPMELVLSRLLCFEVSTLLLLLLLLLFYRAASEGWQPPMSKEDTRESPLGQKCYWHRIIPEVGGHFDPCIKQGTPTTRRRPPLVGLRECSQMHKRR